MTGPDYLWDRSGPPDPDVARLEAALAPLRHRAPLQLPDTARPRRPRRTAWIGGGAVLAAAAALALWWMLRPPAAPACAAATDGFRFEAVAGAPRCDGATVARGWLPVGAALETGAGDAVRVDVADIGKVVLGGGSRLALVASSPREHRLALTRGQLHARVTAPPRLFVVETPAATAVDLGCEYELTVGGDGGGLLRVASGLVELEAPGRLVVVPSGAQARLRAGRGPGTPVALASVARLGPAVDRFDAGDQAALAEILASAGPVDTVTLWNLLLAVDGDARGRVFDRLSELSPPPEWVLRDAVLAGDAQALREWRQALEGEWLYGDLPTKTPAPP